MNLTLHYLMYMVELMGGAWCTDPPDGRGKLPLSRCRLPLFHCASSHHACTTTRLHERYRPAPCKHRQRNMKLRM